MGKGEGKGKGRYRTRDILLVYPWIPRRTLLKRLYDRYVCTRWERTEKDKYRIFSIEDIVEIGIHEELIIYGFMERSSKLMRSVMVVDEFMLPIEFQRNDKGERIGRKRIYKTGVVRSFPVPANWSCANFIRHHDYEVVVRAVVEHSEGRRYYGVTYIPTSLQSSLKFTYVGNFSCLDIDVKRIYNHVSSSLTENSTSEIIA